VSLVYLVSKEICFLFLSKKIYKIAGKRGPDVRNHNNVALSTL